jgi:hypothetical protein
MDETSIDRPLMHNYFVFNQILNLWQTIKRLRKVERHPPTVAMCSPKRKR